MKNKVAKTKNARFRSYREGNKGSPDEEKGRNLPQSTSGVPRQNEEDYLR